MYCQHLSMNQINRKNNMPMIRARLQNIVMDLINDEVRFTKKRVLFREGSLP